MDEGSPVSKQTNPTLGYTIAGTNNVLLSVSNVCGSSVLTEQVSTNANRVTNISSSESLIVYPNFADEFKSVSFLLTKLIAQVSLVNVMGMEVRTSKL